MGKDFEAHCKYEHMRAACGGQKLRLREYRAVNNGFARPGMQSLEEQASLALPRSAKYG